MISDNLQQVNLTPDDVDGAMALSTEAGWNQTADDWRHFISQGATIGVRDEAEGREADAGHEPRQRHRELYHEGLHREHDALASYA